MKESVKNLLLIFSGMLFLLSFIYAFTRPKVQGDYQFQAYLRSTFDDNGYNGLKQGIEQAANDYKVEVTFGVLEEEEADQKVWLENETAAGIEGFIFEPKEEKILESQTIDVPFVYVNQQELVENVPVISADNQKNGYTLGTEVIKQRSNKERVLIVREQEIYQENAENLAGLLQVFEEQEVAFDELIVKSENWEETLQVALNTEEYVAIIGLSLEMSETLGKLKKQDTRFSTIDLYGFGLSNQLLNFVEQDIFQGLGVSNQFAVGYAAVAQLMAQIEGKSNRIPNIDTLFVTKENLFDPDNQKLLFPLIQ